MSSLAEPSVRVDVPVAPCPPDDESAVDDFVLGAPERELTPEQVRRHHERYEAMMASTGNRHLNWLIWLIEETRHCVDDFLEHHLSGPCEEYGGPCAFCRETTSGARYRLTTDLNGILWALESAESQLPSNIFTERDSTEREAKRSGTGERLRFIADRAEESERAYAIAEGEHDEADDEPEPVSVVSAKPR